MDIRTICADDFPLLNIAGGYLKKYGRNARNWIDQGYLTSNDCYIFAAGGVIIGGVCFCDNTADERLILDFAMIDAEMPSGARALREAVKLAATAGTKSIGYNLYDDTEQYESIMKVFTQAGFRIAQKKKSYVYEVNEAPISGGELIFRSLAEAGEDTFVDAVRDVTVGTLDKLMAEDVAQKGGDRAAREYVDSLKELDMNVDWWRLAYYGNELAGLVIPQSLGDNIGCINYVGVLPKQRGRSYGEMLIAEGARILHENGTKKIIADIDAANYPLSAELERVGFTFKMDESVLRWSNSKDVSDCEKEIRGFLDNERKLHTYPVKFKKQLFALCYLASKFEHGKQYTESEVNGILNQWHTFGDWASLRRDLCDRHYLGREPDGSRYWLEEEQPGLASFGLE